MLSSLFWNTALAFTIYLVVVKDYSENDKYVWVYMIFGYLLPLVISILPWIDNDYGNGNGVCWLSEDESK